MLTNKTTGECDDVAPFADLLITHHDGDAHLSISHELHELIEKVDAHGKKGTLTITVTVEPPTNGMDGKPIAIGIESAVKAPKPTPPKALYFVDKDGNPSRQDPRQTSPGIFRAADGTTEFRLTESPTNDFKEI